MTRLLLVWFVLALGAAAATPLVHPQALQLVCSSAGVSTFVSMDEDGTARVVDTLAQCPMCIVTGAPPFWQPPPRLVQPPAAPLPPAIVVERTAARTAPPLPARGPPALS